MTTDKPAPGTGARAVRRLTDAFVSTWNRHVVRGETALPDEPCMVVSNHGFGTLTDLNELSLFATLRRLEVDRATTTLVHQMAWTLGLGPVLESLDCRKAGREAALDALAAGRHVMLFPGGDIEAGKSYADRNRVIFAGRSGFAKLATEAGVPVVPVVTAGAGESLWVLSDGQPVAKALRLDRLLRLKSFPITVSVPWGISFGLVGPIPYLPLPTRLVTTVLPPMWQADDETAADFALRVEAAMQAAMDEMVVGRRPLGL